MELLNEKASGSINKWFLQKLLLIFITCSSLHVTILAQSSSSISGIVKVPVMYGTAFIRLLNTGRSAITEQNGAFKIDNIRNGSYTLAISSGRCATQMLEVNVQGNTDLGTITLVLNNKQLSEVIVTAQKKEENLQKAPLSVSAFTDTDVRKLRLWNIQDLSAVVPNMFAGNPGDGRNAVSVRGIASTSYDPTVTTYIDGVNQFSLDTYIPQVFDVDRIEVLRGPQGTLYGRNAMGGVVNIITREPTRAPKYFAEISGLNYGGLRLSAGAKLSSKKGRLRFGAALLYEKSNGFYRNDFYHQKFDRLQRVGGNYFLKYVISPYWKITLNAKHMLNRNHGAFPLASSIDEAFADPFKVDQDAVTKLVDNIFNTSLSVQHQAKQFSVISQTAYQSNYRYYTNPIDGDFSPIDGVSIINNYGKDWNNVSVWTEELRFQSAPASKLQWTAGMYLFNQDAPNRQAVHFGKDAQLFGSPDINYAIINTTRLSAKGAAVFGQISFDVGELFNLTGGIRYDYQRSKQQVLGEYQPGGSTSPLFQTQVDTSANVSFDAFSPRISFSYQPTSNNNIFITFSRGFRTGGLTQLSSDPSQPPLFVYKPEHSTNIELGSKNVFWKKKLRLNVSLFYSNINDAQVPTLILPDAITVTRNAGKLQSRGVETELEVKPLRYLEASWAFGYTHARYRSLKLSQSGSNHVFDGNHAVFTPDVTSMLAVHYRIPDPFYLFPIKVRGEWAYVGPVYFDLANNIRQSSRHLLNASIGFEDELIELRFWMRNITNQRYISYAYDFGAAHLGDPRTYGVTFRVELK